jgi:hypothetical protein
MKSLKLFLAVCALFVCTCSFAQENKPTKEATIEWLKPKLMEYSSFKAFITKDFKVEIGECEIILTGFEKDGKYDKVVFPTDFLEMKRGDDFFDGKFTLKYNYKAYQTNDEDGKLKPYADEWHFLKMETPPEMAKRIENALRNLQSYCGGQKSDDEPF